MPISGWQNKHMPGTAGKTPAQKTTPQSQETWTANVTNSSNDDYRTFRKIRKSPNRFRVFRPALSTRFAKTPNPSPKTSPKTRPLARGSRPSRTQTENNIRYRPKATCVKNVTPDHRGSPKPSDVCPTVLGYSILHDASW